METNPTGTAITDDVQIKQEREATVESDAPLFAVRRLTNFTQPVRSSTQPESSPSPAHTVVAESKFTSEPVELDPNLRAILETWHEKEGKTVPPCKYYYYNPKLKNGIRPWKAFDREGREVELIHFVIKNPLSYPVLAARFPDNNMKFVCSYLKHHGKYGSFLQAWLGWDAGFESEPCIVRRFHNPGQVIEYRPEAWSYLKEQPTPRGEQRARSGAQSAIQPSPPSVTRKRVADSGATSTSHTKRRQLDERDISPSGSEVSDSSLSSLSDEGGSEDSEVSEDDDEKDASTDTRTGPHQNSANDRPLVNADNEPRSGIENNKPPPTPSQGPELFSS